MKAVVLAAGRGTRIRPLSEPMLPVADRPLVQHVLDADDGDRHQPELGMTLSAQAGTKSGERVNRDR